MIRAMATVAHTTTLEEYLVAEEASVERHEYVNGIVVAMSGGTERHSLLGVALTIAIGTRLRGGPCRTYNSDQRIFVPETKLMAYPDVSVVCGPSEKAPKDRHALTNPKVIVEILSESTASFDRGAKWQHYQRIESLRAYVLVDQDAPRLEVYERDGARWVYAAYEGLDAVAKLSAIEIELPLAELYAGLPAPEEAPAPPSPL
jgi:Uma2 family endonuclease